MKLLDFAESNGWYSFRFGGGLPYDGDPQSFKAALACVKNIPLEEREYHPNDRHLWKVVVSPENEAVLMAAFENGRNCIETLKASVKLPGF